MYLQPSVPMDGRGLDMNPQYVYTSLLLPVYMSQDGCKYCHPIWTSIARAEARLYMQCALISHYIQGSKLDMHAPS